MKFTATRRGALVAAAGMVGFLSLAACSSDDAGSTAESGSGLPKIIRLASIVELSGPVAYSSSHRGEDLAVEEINETGYLGDGVTVEIKHVDGAFDPQVASQEATSLVSSGDVVAIGGPSVSNQSLAVAPIAQSAGIPIVYNQAGIDGLLENGDFQFRISPPQDTFYGITVDHMVKAGGQSASIINTASIPTYNEIGKKLLPELFGKAGIEVTSEFEFEASVVDFQAAAGRVAQESPDAVFVILPGSQTPTVVVQLRRAGYEGTIYTINGVAPRQLEPAGKAGVGVIYPTTFTNANPAESTKNFVNLFVEKYGEAPTAFEAEGYDKIWWIARAINEAGSADPARIRDGLLAIGEKGFAGAQGELTFVDGRDARLENAFLVEWNGDYAQTAGESLVE